MVTQQRLSVAEYLALPEEKPYLEYVCGEVVAKMAPDRVHGSLAAQLAGALSSYRLRAGGTAIVEGRVEFEDMGGARFLLPDVAYYAAGRALDAERAMAPPSLGVEIRSEGQSLSEQREKCRYYRNHGVDVAWLVDPATRSVEVFEGALHLVLEEGETLTSAVLPGLSLPVADLFAGLDS